MTASSPLPAPTLLPLLRYRELGAALDWLQTAFGFEKQVAVSDPDGAVIYAQMTFGPSMLMLGAVRETDLDSLMRQPDEVGGVETQSCYVVVDDADAHHERAVAAGAEVVLPLKSDGLGRRGYTCRDPQGHLWSFGTYNPAKSVTTAEPLERVVPMAAQRAWPRRIALAASLVLAVVSGWWAHAAIPAGSLIAFARQGEAESALSELAKVRAEKRMLDEALAQQRSDVERIRRDRMAALQQVEDVRKEAVGLREANAAAEKAVAELKSELERERERQVRADAVFETKDSSATIASEPPQTVLATRSEGDAVAPTASTGAPSQATAETTSETSGRLETSATNARETPPPKLAQKQSAATQRTKRSASKTGSPSRSSYVVELSDVSWPYTAWHEKHR